MTGADVLVLQDEEVENLFQDGEGEEWPERGSGVSGDRLYWIWYSL